MLQVIRMVGESQETVSVGGGSGSSSNKMPTLEEYGTNLTTQATEVRPTAYSILLLSNVAQLAVAILASDLKSSHVIQITALAPHRDQLMIGNHQQHDTAPLLRCREGSNRLKECGIPETILL